MSDSLDVLDRRLAESEYLAGDDYAIADVAAFPWYGGLAKGWSYGAAEFLSVQDYTNVPRWADAILARPAAGRGRMVNRISGDPQAWLTDVLARIADIPQTRLSQLLPWNWQPAAHVRNAA